MDNASCKKRKDLWVRKNVFVFLCFFVFLLLLFIFCFFVVFFFSDGRSTCGDGQQIPSPAQHLNLEGTVTPSLACFGTEDPVPTGLRTQRVPHPSPV